MSWFDWLILVLPVCLVMGMGFYTRRYVRGVADFLSAGRLCGRYVICVGDVANALSIIGLLTYVEIHYKTGFALAVTLSFTMPGKRITPIAQGDRLCTATRLRGTMFRVA